MKQGTLAPTRCPPERFRKIVGVLKQRLRPHRVGFIQEFRRHICGLKQRPAPWFVADTFAFHNGGRRELQFNVGLENDNTELRHGVAFSFQKDWNNLEPAKMRPWLDAFNDLIVSCAPEYSDMRLWSWSRGERSPNRAPGVIDSTMLEAGAFVFLGKTQSSDTPDLDLICHDFDRLWPLYEKAARRVFATSDDIATNSRPAFHFESGCKPRTLSAIAAYAQKEQELNLQHNKMQRVLYSRLIGEHGEAKVGTEIENGVGGRIDLVVQSHKEYTFYEIKTDLSPRMCLRAAIGQLLEYSYWPGAQVATRLVVVGEAHLDEEGREYLEILEQRLGIEICYECADSNDSA